MKIYFMKCSPLLFAVLVFTACVGNKEVPQSDAEHVIPIETQVVSVQSFKDEISLSGNIEGKKTVKLSFMVPGKIDYISSKEGETVKQGQLLSKLESINYTIAKQLSDVAVNLAKDEFDRLSILYKKGSLSESDYTKSGLSLQQAQLQQRLEEKNVADTRLNSPITGVLLSKHAEVGEVVPAGTPLFVVADIAKVIISAFIPESELHQISIGQPAGIYIEALEKSFTGKITDVGAIADSEARAFSIKIEVENVNLAMRPGMIAEVKIKSAKDANCILVPAEAIIHDIDNQSYIYIVDSKSLTSFRRKISVGRLIENKIEVTAGLSAGETIVTAGQSKLSDGAHISITK
jgi:membrane fusion protein (multidrug efflux system)